MISLPKDLFRHILSFRDLNYELARRSGVPSARRGRYYVILGPTIEYEMIRGRIVSLEWDRPVYSVHGYDTDIIMGRPTRASF